MMSLTGEQYDALAARLEGTAGCATAAARRAFRHAWGAGDAAALAARTGLFCCGVCDRWRGRWDRDPDDKDTCIPCALDMAPPEDDD